MPGKLHLAAADAANGFLLVKELLETTKIDPNEKDENGLRPLEYALQSGSLDTVEYLIETAHLTLENNSYLEMAQKNSADVQIYVADKFLNNELHRAAYLGFVEEILAILSKSPRQILENSASHKNLFYWIGIQANIPFGVISIIEKNPAFKTLFDNERDALWRGLVAACVMKDKQEIAYKAILQIKKPSDNEYILLAKFRREKSLKIFDFCKTLNEKSNVTAEQKHAIKTTIANAEKHLYFAFKNLEHIQNKNNRYYEELADCYQLRANIHFSNNKNNEAINDLKMAIQLLEKNTDHAQPDYHKKLSQMYLMLADNYQSVSISKTEAALEKTIEHYNLVNPSTIAEGSYYLNIMELYSRLSKIYFEQGKELNKSLIPNTQDNDAITIRTLQLSYYQKATNLGHKEAALTLGAISKQFKFIYDNNSNRAMDCYHFSDQKEYDEQYEKGIKDREWNIDNDFNLDLNAHMRTSAILQLIKHTINAKMTLEKKILIINKILGQKEILPYGIPQWISPYLSYPTLLPKNQNSTEGQLNKSLPKDHLQSVYELYNTANQIHLDAAVKLENDLKKIEDNDKKKELIKQMLEELELAAINGHKQANEKLGDIYRKGILAPQDMSKALMHLDLAQSPERNKCYEECINNFKVALDTKNVEVFLNYIDQMNYPLDKRIAQEIVPYILTSHTLNDRKKSMLLTELVARGIEIGIGIPNLNIFSAARTPNKSHAHTIDFAVPAFDHNILKITTEYVGLKMRGNQGLFWGQKQANSKQKAASEKSKLPKLPVSNTMLARTKP